MASITSKIFENICEALASSPAAAYVPSTAYTGGLPNKVVKKGSKGTNVKHVQKFLNWCIHAGLKVDGSCGSKTVKAIKKFQKQYGLKQDGVFGSKCRAKARNIINSHASAPIPTPTPAPIPTPTPAPIPTPTPAPSPEPSPVTNNAQRIVEKAREFAWPSGTAKSKYTYPKGSAKSAYKSALKKYMGKKAKISQTDCGYFVNTCVRSSGTAGKFTALPANSKKKYPSVPSSMYIASKGGVGTLQPGDVIRYRKKGGQHTVIYLGDGKIAHASRKHAFPRVSSSKPWTNSNVKKSTIQVIRAK